MKTRSAILILLCVLLTACGEAAESFEIQNSGEVFASDNAVYCLDNDGISVYGTDGTLIESAESPEALRGCAVSGSCALAYGENEFFLSNGRNIRHNHLTGKIMSTAINRNGYCAVCTEEAGYKGSVTVFDETLTPVYKWYSADGWIIKAALSEKNILAVLTANGLGSTAHVFSLDSEEEQFSVSVPDTLCIDLCFSDDRLFLLSETAVYYTRGEKIVETVSFDRTLGYYALNGEFSVFELCGDGESELLCLNSKGREKGRAQCEMLRGIAANDARIAVLSGNDAVLFNNSLNEVFSADARGVRSALVCGDDMLLLRDGNVIAYK